METRHRDAHLIVLVGFSGAEVLPISRLDSTRIEPSRFALSSPQGRAFSMGLDANSWIRDSGFLQSGCTTKGAHPVRRACVRNQRRQHRTALTLEPTVHSDLGRLPLSRGGARRVSRAAHDSGVRRVVTSFQYASFIRNPTPVYPGATPQPAKATSSGPRRKFISLSQLDYEADSPKCPAIRGLRRRSPVKRFKLAKMKIGIATAPSSMFLTIEYAKSSRHIVNASCALNIT